MDLRTETVDGLEFTVPTWDATPVERGPFGSWVKDEELEARIRSEIMAAIPGYEDLVKHALTAMGGASCNVYWGSHGCDLDMEHPGLHRCGPPEDPCSAILPWGEGDTAIMWWYDSEDESFWLSTHRWTWFTLERLKR